MQQIIIIGGGLGGLISAIMLKKAGFEVLVIEKNQYPFHKVCGEYISNEVKPFLQSQELFPGDLTVAAITNFTLSAPSGSSASIPLDLGGFGVSRFALDDFLFQKATTLGVSFLQEQALHVTYFSETSSFEVELKNGEILTTPYVIGAYGKRSSIDKSLQRSFISKRSPYIGVKYHIEFDSARDEVALHNFEGGYCGINAVENGKFNLCYLSSRHNLKKYGSIEKLEKNVLSKNPHLKAIFKEARFIFDKPLVINEISFETKKPVEQHILMCGDAAGMIAPLCGNGMAMAIHSAKILSESLITGLKEGWERSKIEAMYAKMWQKEFARRLSVGRNLQKLFGDGFLSGLSVGVIKHIKPLAHFLVEKTHGKPF